MARNDPDFSFETEMDLDSVDEKAAKALEDKGAKAFSDIEVEEVADTRVAPADRTAKPLPADYNPEPSEEELASYSKAVKERIGKLTHAREDERREKEQAQRERDEAIQFAQNSLARQRQIEEQAVKLRAFSADTSIAKVDSDIAAAKKEFIEAANAYDSEAMAEAQFKMSTLAAQKSRLETQKESAAVAQPQKEVVQSAKPAQPAPDRRAQDWAARNDGWFQKDKSMTAFAFGVHEDLVSRGVDPRTDAELYYKKLDEEIRTRFPEKFETDDTPAPRTTRLSSPVAPATRSATGRKRVTLTTTEVSLARRLGVTPEAFAAEKLKLSEIR